MNIGDTITLVLLLLVLGGVGFTIYAYVTKHHLSHYALGISVAGIIALIFITKSSGNEQQLDWITDTWKGSLGESDSRRKYRWGGKKRN
jgi:hypothetical protein